MKFNEKLMKLRKSQGMSQEELGEKLNVTRQTVSKWELGETTPEMDKLVEMSKLFNVTVDELTKEGEVKEYNNYEANYKMNEDSKNGINWRPIIIIGILVIVLIASVYYLTIGFIGKKAFGIIDKSMGVFDTMIDKAKEQVESSDEIKNMASQAKEQYEDAVSGQQDIVKGYKETLDNFINDNNLSNNEDKSSHNGTLESLYTGVKNGFHVKYAINQVITINQKSDRKITVIYGNINTSDINQIASITGDFNQSSDYLLTYDYDADGYICTMHISKI